MNGMHNYHDVTFVYNRAVIIESYFMQNVFTDDYLIGIHFHTQEGSKSSMMHHCLIKVAFHTHTNPVTQKKSPSRSPYAWLQYGLCNIVPVYFTASGLHIVKQRHNCRWDSLVFHYRIVAVMGQVDWLKALIVHLEVLSPFSENKRVL